MNKELEEAINRTKRILIADENKIKTQVYISDLKIFLNYIENSISKEVIEEKIEQLEKRINYLDTELNKCYIEREKIGTETDIDINETYIFQMEQEREYRYEQKIILQELLEGK